MGVLKPAQLERVRQVMERFMGSECVILRPTEERYPTGGRSNTVETPVATVKCSVGPVTRETRHVADQVQAGITAVVTMPALTDVRITDRLEIEGEKYEVQQTIKRSADMEITRKALVT